LLALKFVSPADRSDVLNDPPSSSEKEIFMKLTKRTSLLLLALILMIGMMVFGDRKALVATAAPPATSVMIVDRGLPTINLNNTAGANRANVSWAEPDLNYFDGDDFKVPPALESGFWRIDTIRMWIVGYGANNNRNLIDDTFLGNFYPNVSLYVGAVGSPLKRVALANFVPGSDGTDNPNVVAKRVQYNRGVGTELDYQGGSGSYYTIVQLDFTNLNLYFEGGKQVQFGMHTDGDYAFSHASNAGLSGSPQDQADGLFRQFQLNVDPATATFLTTVNSYPSLWDKSSDINVQVFATAVDEEQCKDGRWKTLFRADGTPFKNQGACIQYFEDQKDDKDKKDKDDKDKKDKDHKDDH
jgi:hypothetical protein